MKTGNLHFRHCFTLGLVLAVPLFGEGPIIPPSVAKISPAGMQRGNTVVFTIEGRSLTDATAVIFDAPGLSGKVTQITDVAEQITGPRAGVDLGAQVPLGKKQTAKLEITAAKDALPGVHRFRVKTPLGTSNVVAVGVGLCRRFKTREAAAMDAGTPPQTVDLPATLIGTIASNGEKHTYQFDGKAGEEIVFSVQASKLGSKLASMLVLSDSSGQILASAGQSRESPDAELNYKLTQDGKYTISITDRDLGGGEEYFYGSDGASCHTSPACFHWECGPDRLAEIPSKESTWAESARPKSYHRHGRRLDDYAARCVGGIRPVNEVKTRGRQ